MINNLDIMVVIVICIIYYIYTFLCQLSNSLVSHWVIKSRNGIGLLLDRVSLLPHIVA